MYNQHNCQYGIILFAFDLLFLDGVDIRSWPYRERLAALMNLLFSVQQTTIKLAETAFTAEQKLAMLRRLKAGKREGIVFKQVFAPYTPGKPNSGGNQLKHKFVATLSPHQSNPGQQPGQGGQRHRHAQPRKFPKRDPYSHLTRLLDHDDVRHAADDDQAAAEAVGQRKHI